MRRAYGLLSIFFLAWPAIAGAQDLRFERVVIDNDFPGAYQVEVADVNGDKKPDIVAVGGGTCAWYENPSWKKRIITGPKQSPGVISSATVDLDGDGKAEVAIAYEFEMSSPKKGKLLIASQGATAEEPWTITPMMPFGSIHRLRWADFDGDKRPELVIAPLFGPEAKAPEYWDPAPLTAMHFRKGFREGPGDLHLLDKRPVLHAIRIFQTDQFAAVLTADNLGVASIIGKRGGFLKHGFGVDPIMSGAEGSAPKRGASEIHVGNLKGSGLGFIATIEPWHGDRVVVCTLDPKGEGGKGPLKTGSRTVLDETLDDGHALWVADIDGDGEDEIFAGHRGKDHRVSMYDYDPKAKTWSKTVIDRDIAAQDLRGGDLDGDGRPDVVAVGGATHNVVWYRPRK